ncbi:hypothetical protein [Candidatus Methanoperedens nitratireducens]|uniref:Uncharacterized protein n=1 Tax=Candidatus Methanoperedens nitratireducens TaxID=1392998 RepID=A0A284VMG0_9EURY|nr:hypothetical protein [Candidatus Methanoperedens nitroreducens]SNQ60444.1 hypothetical protein MNV_1800028 [Candidatus Methanoperedens nitroreducens]
MDWIIAIGIVGSLASIIGVPFLFRDSLMSSNIIRRAIFWLSNKSFFVKIKAVKKYPCFDYNTKAIERAILSCSRDNKKIINFKKIGKNYIQILYEGMQAPLYISFEPDIGNEEEPEEQEHCELPQELNISMRVLGEIEFKYRKDKNNKSYLKLMESLYKLIERESGNVVANYEKYTIDSTPCDFVYDWTKSKSEISNNTSIFIGDKVVQINTKSLASLYDIFKDNRIRYQNISLFLNPNIHKAEGRQ